MSYSTGFEMNVGVAILRVKEGLDCSGILGDVDDIILKASSKKNKEKKNIIAQTGNEIFQVSLKTWFSVSIHINRFQYTMASGNAVTTTEELSASTLTIIQTEIKSTKNEGFKSDKKKNNRKTEQNLALRYLHKTFHSFLSQI